jgi:NAD/NADP transhydrogenase beta subunit
MEGIVIPVSFFLMVFAIVYISLTTRNRERMAMIEKGVDPKIFTPEPRNLKVSQYITFKWGLFLVGLAVGLFVGAMLDQYSEMPEGPMYISMILAFGGLALILAYLLRGRLEKNKE